MTSEQIQCPDVILGKYDILADSRVNSLACSSPVWNGCTDIQTMSVSEKGVLCNGTYFFSGMCLNDKISPPLAQ
ncbi:hypothetical protein DPMN_116518 [Dreissena polymorpha]|uniref:Uncharacterized protein n=1 Tax=Dreissena polymorpha TaxID=45954 RepID=A0A9D4KPK6_DREPO|nr:hypothetical protein DPMN_116518 [Dreissena polymorpha]